MADRTLFQSDKMPDVTDHTQLALAIGEMRGQVREMVYTQNNLLQQVQSMSVIVMSIATLPDTVATLSSRVASLEKIADRREGRETFLLALFRSPALGWVVGAATTIYLWVSGRLDV